MKHISTLLTLSAGVLASASAAAAQAARVYTFDTEQQPSTTSSSGESLSADTARLILSQRLGSSQYSELGEVDESVLDQLNKFGGAQQPILGAQDKDGDVSRLLVVVEGVDKDIGSSISESSTGDFVVDKLQDEIVQEGLIDNLLTRKTATGNPPRLPCSYDFEDEHVLGTLDFNILSTEKCPSKQDIFKQTDDHLSLSNLKTSSWTGRGTNAVLKIKSQKSTEILDSLKTTILPELASLAKEQKQESTLLLLPSTSTTSSSKLTRRNAQQNTWQSPVSSSEPSTSPTTSPPSALLPVCHTSNSSCVESTNNCSGHGACYKKYSTSSDGSGDCYACRCERTVVRKNEDGSVKTVQWGGPACQKKDVSVPFWLLAGFSVLLVSAISWGVGLLYSVGSEELPSVIGAGVAMGKAQK